MPLATKAIRVCLRSLRRKGFKPSELPKPWWHPGDVKSLWRRKDRIACGTTGSTPAPLTALCKDVSDGSIAAGIPSPQEPFSCFAASYLQGGSACLRLRLAQRGIFAAMALSMSTPWLSTLKPRADTSMMMLLRTPNAR